MNMIICDQNCRHQNEGYCGLNHIAQITNDINAKCGYFEVRDKKLPVQSGALSDDGKSL